MASSTLANVRLDRVNISNCGIGVPARHALWIRQDGVGGLTLGNSHIADIQNDSARFTIVRESQP